MRAAAVEGLRRGLAPRVERRLIRAVQVAGPAERDRAYRALVKAYAPLLGARVQRFRGRGLDEAELAQVARIGFLRAVERFDLARTTSLASYAIPWVEGALRRAVAVEPNEIHLPERVVRKAWMVWSGQRELTALLGRAPREEELADWLGLSTATVREALSLPRADVSLGAIDDSEVLVDATRARPGAWEQQVQARLSDGEEQVVSAVYGEVELRGLLEDYLRLRSALELRPSSVGEPRLRRHSRVREVCRLADVDEALMRVPPGRLFIVLELVGIRDVSLRAAERLLQVRFTTLADRYRRGTAEVVGLLNEGVLGRPVVRRPWWRDLHARTLEHAFWIASGGEYEPVAWEIWARFGAARYIMAGEIVPVGDVPNGDGWMLTPGVARDQDPVG
jgi:DNA-directed RNA polymerase specialized sigma subunit